MTLFPSQRWFSVVVLIFGWLISGLWDNGYTDPPADCRTSYRTSTELLDAATEKAIHNQHPDEDVFAEAFKKQVGKLQAEKCMPELMNLLQHIEAQKKKYSSTPAGTAQEGATP